MLRFLLGFLFFFTVSLSALADAPMPLLRATVVVHADVVTAGDLFDHAGLAAETPVFRAPAPGSRGSVPAEAVARAARAAGLDRVDLGGLSEVLVERAGHFVTADDIRTAVEDVLADALGVQPESLDVTYSAFIDGLYVPAEAGEPFRAELRRRPDNAGRFEAEIRLAGEARPVTVTGRAVEMVEVAVMARSLARGERITGDAVRVERIAARRLPRRGALDIADIEPGLAATRALRAGSMLAPGDLAAPPYVERNGLVTLIYRAGALQLTARGRALDVGAEGSLVSVLNLQSNRVVQGVVSAPGLVVVTAGIGSVASLGAQQ
ncbi:MAG: flagellar basal body P-ring formation protein FlgA [Hyphomicrobiaceae bacterium]|nr:flagellar basal body P-ring formation protein FlgA [Hyphomicrobiaceae bacterium]